MSTREYIGARYVPIFADPITWDPTQTYEPLTVVLYQGNSYTSRQAVPENIDISNQTYWAQTGNYNAQVEQYRQEVQTFNGRITQNATDITDEETTRADADTALQTAINNEATARANADTAINRRIDAIISSTKYTAIVGDSWSDSQLTAAIWPSLYATALNRGLINKSENGSGFVRSGTGGRGTNFYMQLQEVIADQNYSDCDEVIIFGGINDISYGEAAIKTAISQCSTLIRQMTASGRKVFLCFGNSGNGRLLNLGNYDALISTIKSYCLNTLKIPIVDCVNWWLACSDVSLFNSDNLHPNAAGNNAIAAYMQQLHNGIYNGVHKTYIEDISLVSNTYYEKDTGAKIRLDFDDGITRIRSGEIRILLDSSGPKAPNGSQITDNFGNENYWHSYGSGTAWNDGTVIYPYEPTGQIAVNIATGNIGVMRIGMHRYANAGFFTILGLASTFSTGMFPSGKIPINFDFVL